MFISKNIMGLTCQKKQLIVSRLSNTLAKMGYTDFTKYVDDLVSSRRPEMVTDMLNKLTTNYTYFMREEEHFNYLYQTVLPDLAKKHAHDKVLSIWSAGCSSGEEPYTISMYLKDFSVPRLLPGIPESWPQIFHRVSWIPLNIPLTMKKAWPASPLHGSTNIL